MFSYNDLLLKNGRIWNGTELVAEDMLILDGKVSARGNNLIIPEFCTQLDLKGKCVFPGLIDVHVHLREPGYEYKETIAAGTAAAAAGGFTAICPMPNINPVPDSMEHLKLELDAIDRDAVVNVYPYASITKKRLGKELVDYAALAPYVAGFSDDGSGVQDEEIMHQAMTRIAATGKVLAAHCEVNDLLRGGYIHDGEYARCHGHRGICSESEWKEIERNIRLCRQTGCRLHICHISTKESVQLIRQAKTEGLPVTCETAAHYLVFDDSQLQEDGRFKMNPPIRSKSDYEALWEGIIDGTIDCIASDHAPHSLEEKSRGLEKSAMGVSGLEVSFPAMYTYGVKTGKISLLRLMQLMWLNPGRIFGIGSDLNEGDAADFTIIDLDEEFTVKGEDFLSKGKITPFEGIKLFGKVHYTFVEGTLVFRLMRTV